MALRLRAPRRPLLLRRRPAARRRERSRTSRRGRRSRSRVGGLALAWVGLRRALPRRRRAEPARARGVSASSLLALAAWAASELFAARAAYLQVGAMLGTIMAANVLLVIIPAHRKLVRRDGGGRASRIPRRSSRRSSAPSTTTTSRCRCSSRCSPGTSRSSSDTSTRGSRSCSSPCSSQACGTSSTSGTRGAACGGSSAAVAVARRRARVLARAGGRAVGAVDGPVPFAQVAADRRAALRDLPRGRGGSARRPPRDRGGDRRRARRTSSARRSLDARDAAGQRDGDDGRGARAPRRLDRAALGSRACSRSRPAASSSEARFEEDAAPDTVAAFRRMLPLESQDHPRPLVGRGRLDPDGRPRRRHRPRERDALPEPGRAHLLSGRRERDRAAARVRLRRLREQGRRARGEPLRDDRRGRTRTCASSAGACSGRARRRSSSARADGAAR